MLPGPSLFVPGGIKSALTRGYCLSECTQLGFPETGVKIVGVLLHAHIYAFKLKLRHIRNGTELAPILANEAFDFNYQQTEILFDEITVLPGDDLIMECTYDTSSSETMIFGGERYEI